jgi:hypothetical protein
MEEKKTVQLSYAGVGAKTGLVVSWSPIVGLFLVDKNMYDTKLFENYFCISFFSC